MKGIRSRSTPIHRVESVKCLRWHKIGKTSSIDKRQASEVLCKSCIVQRSHLDRKVQRKLAESPGRKSKRQCASSKAKLTYMSPLSQQKRKYDQRQKMHSTQVKLTKYQQTEITLDEQQDEEMENMMKVIEQQSSEKLEELFQEGEKHGVGDKLHQI